MQALLRPLAESDIEVVARIHAASWRSAYRGMLQDEFLDGDLEANRAVLWTKRLSPMPRGHFGYLASYKNQPVGFAFAFGEHDTQWGTQVDNLHVLQEFRCRGIGSMLLASVAAQAVETHGHLGIYLWVYERNLAARKYYEGIGAVAVERAVITPPGGGMVSEWRYTWPSAAALLSALKREA